MDVLATRGVDAVVTDIDMPRGSGIDLVRQIRATRPQLPCIFVTGGVPPAGLAGEVVIEKPFTVAVLQSALLNALAAWERRASDRERVDRLALRLKSDCARSLLDHWRALRHGVEVPRIEQFRLESCNEPHRMVVAQVELSKVPIHFNFTLVGNSLRNAADRRLASDQLPVSGNDTIAAREAAYRRCALTGQPSYEYARIDLGESAVETFERLLLPFSSDGVAVNWIVGTVVIENEKAGPAG